MKRNVFLTVALALFLLAGCGCQHEWQDASCIVPKTCINCQETEGESIGHNWQDASCMVPKTCIDCQATEGETIDHSWEEATCTVPKTCAVCDLTEGDVLPHEWVEVSCAAPKHCSACSLTEGEALPHTWQEANYQRAQSCTVCGAEEGQPVPGDYELAGIVCNMEVDAPYTYCTATYDDRNLTATGTVTISDYKIFESDSTHPAKEGYEWRSACVRIVFEPENARDKGIRMGRWLDDYYVAEWSKRAVKLGANGDMTYRVNYLGEDVEIYCVVENYKWTGWSSGKNTYSETLYFQVPVGYDGVTIAFMDSRTMGSAKQSNTATTKAANENCLFFRFN